MSETQELHQCPACPKRYKRREHLQRHWASHGSNRPHRCSRCGRAFQRHDVLRRHARTCEARAGLPSSPAGSGKRRACDLCARQKKGCTAGRPCRNCARLAVACTYSFEGADPTGREDDASRSTLGPESESGDSTAVARSFDDPDPVRTAFEDINAVMFGDQSELDFLEGTNTNTSWLDFLNLVSDVPGPAVPSHGELAAQEQQSHQQQHQHTDNVGHYSFRFLENFTKQTAGLIESFDCATLALREQTVAAFLQQQRQQAECNSVPGGLASYTDVPTQSPNDSLLPSGCIVPAPLGPNSWLHDPLMIKVHQIIVFAKEVVSAKPRNSAVTVEWTPLLEQKCVHFFSPTNVRKFLTLYWTIWHPNVNFVHRPTFDASTSKSILVAAMAVLGECLLVAILREEGLRNRLTESNRRVALARPR